MILKIALGLVVLVAAVLGFAATRPDTLRVERTARIQAPPAAVYPHLVDLRGWTSWSPYEKLDPGMRRTFGGSPQGEGATYAWSGNAKAGAGVMRITEARTDARVVLALDFEKPFKASNTAKFTLAPDGDGTRVTWAMHGPMHFASKVMCLFLDMDSLLGKDFEAGLAALKEKAEDAAREKAAAAPSADPAPQAARALAAGR